MENARLHFPDMLDAQELSVRTFKIEEEINGLFTVCVRAVTTFESLDLSALVGHSAELTLVVNEARRWQGVCTSAEFVRASETREGLATYDLILRPTLWRLTQRRGNRLFQHATIPEIVTRILREWGIEHQWQVAPDSYPSLELRTQFDESDFAFVSRLLEESGISYWTAPDQILILGDAPQSNQERPGTPIPFVDEAASAHASRTPFITRLRLREESLPGRVTLRDYDFRRPRHVLTAQADSERTEELAHEQYAFSPGASLSELDAGLERHRATPVADDLGVARFREVRLTAEARLQVEAVHAERRLITFETNIVDVAPGTVFRILNHPRQDLGVDRSLLAIKLLLEGDVTKAETWRFTVAAVTTSHNFRPRRATAKPRIYGLLNAVVVGASSNPTGRKVLPGGVGDLSNTPLSTQDVAQSLTDNDIYVDEHGRVRVQFPWDRESEFGSEASIWMRVSHGWAGSGYGMFTVPRVGHEVLIAYLNGDPDCPVIVGSVHNEAQAVPFPLPENKTVSTWKTASSPGGGGFNELRFDDARGREHVYVQAQKDMDQLVKNNSKESVGGDRSRFVQNDDGVAVGHDRTKFVNMNELEATGLNRVQFVGLNHTRSVGAEESTQVGTRWSVTVARGMTTRMVKELDRLANSLGGVMRAAATSTLGAIGSDPLAKAADAALAGFGRKAFDTLTGVLNLQSGFDTDPGPAPTSIEVVDRKITFTTGEASIVLDGPNVTITAQGAISFHSMGDTVVLAERELALAGREKVALVSATDDLILQAKKDLHLNPYESSTELEAADGLEGDPVADAMRCGVCSGALLLGPEGWFCPNDMEEMEEQS